MGPMDLFKKKKQTELLQKSWGWLKTTGQIRRQNEAVRLCSRQSLCRQQRNARASARPKARSEQPSLQTARGTPRDLQDESLTERSLGQPARCLGKYPKVCMSEVQHRDGITLKSTKPGCGIRPELCFPGKMSAYLPNHHELSTPKIPLSTLLMITLIACGHYVALNNFRAGMENIQPAVWEADLASSSTLLTTENDGNVFLSAGI